MRHFFYNNLTGLNGIEIPRVTKKSFDKGKVGKSRRRKAKYLKSMQVTMTDWLPKTSTIQTAPK